MAKVILAVSGGVDSMVMLDMICRQKRYSSGDIMEERSGGRSSTEPEASNPEIIVAHFDHGTRESSEQDAEFVAKKAKEYGLGFRLGRAELGPDVDEATARAARYDFLCNIDPLATILTAHHLDDLVETTAINFVRGTGWRGLAGLDSPRIFRPLLEADFLYEPMDRAAIMEYAAKRGLTWHEDPTNSSGEYLRNRLRHEMNNSPLSFEEKLRIFELWQRQKELKREIDAIVTSLLPDDNEAWQRSWFRRLDEDETERKVARELLRAGTLRAGVAATRPQLEDFRQAILNYASGKKFNLPGDKLVKLEKTSFLL